MSIFSGLLTLIIFINCVWKSCCSTPTADYPINPFSQSPERTDSESDDNTVQSSPPPSTNTATAGSAGTPATPGTSATPGTPATQTSEINDTIPWGEENEEDNKNGDNDKRQDFDETNVKVTVKGAKQPKRKTNTQRQPNICQECHSKLSEDKAQHPSSKEAKSVPVEGVRAKVKKAFDRIQPKRSTVSITHTPTSPIPLHESSPFASASNTTPVYGETTTPLLERKKNTSDDIQLPSSTRVQPKNIFERLMSSLMKKNAEKQAVDEESSLEMKTDTPIYKKSAHSSKRKKQTRKSLDLTDIDSTPRNVRSLLDTSTQEELKTPLRPTPVSESATVDSSSSKARKETVSKKAKKPRAETIEMIILENEPRMTRSRARLLAQQRQQQEQERKQQEQRETALKGKKLKNFSKKHDVSLKKKLC